MSSKGKAVAVLDSDDPEDASDPLASYLEYNRVLRTWFVTFGVAGPALFLANKEIAQALMKTGSLTLVAGCFLFGATAQILGALLNKVANWYVYISAIDESFKNSRRCKLAEWLIRQFWIDIAVDIITISVFGVAAWQMFTIFSKVS